MTLFIQVSSLQDGSAVVLEWWTLAALCVGECTSQPVYKILLQLHVHWPVLLLQASGCGMCLRLSTLQGFLLFSHAEVSRELSQK